MQKKVIGLMLALFILLSSLPLTSFAKLFNDVSTTAWYASPIEFCYANSLMNGVGKGNFDPKGNTTREQMIIVLANISSADVSSYTGSPFADVPSGKWYSGYVAWGKAMGYTEGVGNGRFGLGEYITRESAVTMLYNYAAKNGFSVSADASLSAFSDHEKVSAWALDAVKWAVGSSVMAGANGMLNPRSNITRAELSQLLMTLCYNVLYSDHEHSFNEISCIAPSVCGECGLIRALEKPHSYDGEVNCINGAYCKECSAFLPPMGHSYIPSTCTSPMICRDCGHIANPALGHTTDNGVCSACGIEIFKNDTEKFKYYIAKYGIKHGEKRYYAANISYTSGDTASQYLWYNTANTALTLENNYHFKGSSDYIKTTITFTLGAASYGYSSVYYQGGKALCSGSGSIAPRSFDESVAFSLGSYSGSASYKAAFTTLTQRGLCYNINGAADLLRSHTGLPVSVLGFK